MTPSGTDFTNFPEN